MTDNLLSKYFQLLAEAARTSLLSNRHDLDTSDAVSVEEWNEMLHHALVAQTLLIGLIATNLEELTTQLRAVHARLPIPLDPDDYEDDDDPEF